MTKKGVIYSYESGLGYLAQVHLGVDGWNVVESIPELLSDVQNGVRAVLIYGLGVALPENLTHTSGEMIHILALSGIEKPIIPPGTQFITFEPSTFVSTIKSLVSSTKIT